MENVCWFTWTCTLNQAYHEKEMGSLEGILTFRPVCVHGLLWLPIHPFLCLSGLLLGKF